ncbi:MAG: glutamate--tRNA ligase [Planctomycetes bacterium]|nr:glutamate--tRNA ligase [Planctomycetota bacterium]
MDVTTSIRTRFAPSPTGHLHVGSARTALFCHLLARSTGGTFLLRIEDTDVARHVEGAVEQIIEDLRWLGLDWDEGVGVGGPLGPYRQSERLDLYNEYIHRLLVAGRAYYVFETAEELQAMRETAEADKRTFLYPRPDVLPTGEDARRAAAEGRPVAIRFACPGVDVMIHDEVFGDVTVPAAQQEDFIIRKADGWPTYHLANVVDDALMGVNFILRGQEFLGQTWRHKLLREALGFPEPRYAHLPLIMDMAGRKLSKRDGDVDIFSFRKAGYLPEAMVSFIALLGWSPGGQKEIYSLPELRSMFDIARLGKANAKFDREKLLAFNTDVAASAGEDRLLAAFQDFLSINDTPFPAGDEAVCRHLLRANKGFRTFEDIVFKSGILFEDDQAVQYDPKAVQKVLDKADGEGWRVLGELKPLLADCAWEEAALEKLVADYCQTSGLGMGKVAQPLRVAVTGRTISPALTDTLLLLGKAATLARIDRCLNGRP